MANTQNISDKLSNQAGLRSSNNAARIASSSAAETITGNWRKTGVQQLMTYSNCKSFRINNNFVTP